eukprot:CAMPEP_0114539560 /NCGR_PEP_ID=MMETSP0114-20121206/301_1 /TAXON_ID=31324 /ORGANISM="Goniomonas sp, Strain m" /LENGTH=63 /DNA_ID=CAMNT_0001723667 /DNA_START=13 /DNA_END=201 /DNA_ORIENTATION=-
MESGVYNRFDLSDDRRARLGSLDDSLERDFIIKVFLGAHTAGVMQRPGDERLGVEETCERKHG